MATRMWVGGVADSVAVTDLFQLFGKYGDIDSIVVRPNYAFVEMNCEQEADTVVGELHETELHGSAITVEEAKSRQNTAITSQVSVFIAGLPKDMDVDTLREKVAECTQHEIKDVIMHVPAAGGEGEDGPAEETQDAIAEVVFENEDTAREVCQALRAADLPGPNPKCFIGIRFHGGRRPRKNRPDSALPFPIQLVVRNSLVGAIIGRGGSNIKQLSQASSARVDLERRDPQLAHAGRRVFIDGTLNNTVEAFRALVHLMADNDHELNPEDAEEPVTSIELMIPGDMVGHLIGRAGSSIKYITETSGATVELIPLQYPANVPPVRMVKIEGTPRQMTHAFALMLRKFSNAMRKGMELMRNPPMMGMMQQQQQMTGLAPPYVPGFGQGMMMPPMEVMTVHVPSWSVGALIGRGGSYIKQMMDETGAEIRIQTPGEEGDDLADRECTVRGTSDQQVRAHSLIFRRMQDEQMRLNIEPTDPRGTDFFPVSLVVPASKVGRVIGRGGGTIREIQQTTFANVDVEQNQENPDGDAVVRVSGPFRAVQAALNMLRGILHK